MVAVIKTGNSIRRSFQYNENKVQGGVADCFMAGNYPLDLEQMTPSMRLNMLQKVAERNPDVVRNSVHISLNFAPGETLSKAELGQIAADYMERIGFGDQPYLAYRHFDAGHPHIHIVSVKIRPDGTKIDMNNIGRKQSETARKAIELKYGLVKAEEHKGKVFRLPPIDATVVNYGATATKRAITNVLDSVLERYTYTTLGELNAVLNLYNVSAERGNEGSRTYNAKGLVYRVVNSEGRPVSAPIKASAFYNKPTLAYLEKRFGKNEKEREKHLSRIKNRIDLAFIHAKNASLSGLVSMLRKDGIATVTRYTEDGSLYGITYIDHKNKCVVNGGALGPTYAANGILERCHGTETAVRQLLNKAPSIPAADPADTSKGMPSPILHDNDKSLWELVAEPEFNGTYLPGELTGKKKKRKKRRSI